MKTRIASIAATLAVVLGALLISAPANARPLHRFDADDHGGSCARVMVGAWGACDFPNLQSKRHYKAHHCWNPAFRENHGRICAHAVNPDAR